MCVSAHIHACVGMCMHVCVCVYMCTRTFMCVCVSLKKAKSVSTGTGSHLAN